MTHLSQPLVSVVTPLYNAEPYLAECIESVLAQTYSNWEYVIVNNCSTDRSREIALSYAKEDARIRVIDNEDFLPAIANWNHALRQISAESVYCKVVHADDWLLPNCIAEMVAVAEANPSVGMVSAYRLEEDRVDLDGLPHSRKVVPGREVCRLALSGQLYLFGSPTSHLVRSDLIRKTPAFYDESLVHADTDACFRVLQESDLGFVHQVLTYTRRHNESITSFVRRFDTDIVERLYRMDKYGPACMEANEFRKRRNVLLNRYYRKLAQGVLQRKPKEYWAYQRQKMATHGIPLRPLHLLAALGKEFAFAMLWPKRSAEPKVQTTGSGGSRQESILSRHSEI
jgi:glycosyltransferase involved in cell wall biosynthesis